MSLQGGGIAHIGANGQIRSVNRNGIHIEHNLHGGRTIVSEHGGKRIVTTGRQGGYVQKPYMTRGGHSYYQRTYYNHGQYQTGVYRSYSYGGQTYYGYTPTAYYSPAYYGWAYNAWPDPVAWDAGSWGWAGAPWYSYYGFAPYPVYASPAFWLTDYVIAANLQAAYVAAAEVPIVAPAPVVATGLPLRIIEHEGNSTDSPVWTFNGTVGIGQFTTGNQPLTIERFDGGTIAVRRQDIGGISALYVGQVTGNFVSGQVTYFGRDGSTPVGVWTGTIVGWAPGAAAAPAPAVPAVTSMPQVLNECEGPWCGTWTWDGAHYRAMWNQGSVGMLTIVRWDAQGIVISRVDPAGTTTGNMSTYTGMMTGPNTASGGEQGVFQGNPWSLAWTITSPTPLFATAPAAVAAAPGTQAPDASAPSGSDPVALTPDLKQAIADEVKAQLKAESAAARSAGGQSGAGSAASAPANELPPALDPVRRTFVVASDLVVTADGQECSLTQGDVLTRLTDTPDADGNVNVSVSGSKKNDCAAGKQVAISVNDLQEMRNHLGEQLDEGMKSLASKQGTGNMPKAPDTSTQAGSVPAPDPDTTASQELKDQQAAADQTETEVKQETAQK